MESVFRWIITQVLAVLLSRAEKRFEEAREQARIDGERLRIDEENIKRLAEAKDRAERIKRAMNLLNGTSP